MLFKARHVHFVGIGGIGMSALARYFAVNGKHVAGFDRVKTAITISLERLGVEIHTDDSMELIPTAFRDSNETLVVYTPAISESHQELRYFKSNGFTVLKRSEVLGLITKSTFCLAVAGTHGKTTTSTILGHILKESGVGAEILKGKYGQPYLLDYVFDEFATLVQARTKRNDIATRLGNKILNAKYHQLIRVNYDIFKNAWQLFQNQKGRKGKYLSFTDCTIISTAQFLKIENICTLESNFRNVDLGGIQIISEI